MKEEGRKEDEGMEGRWTVEEEGVGDVERGGWEEVGGVGAREEGRKEHEGVEGRMEERKGLGARKE